MEREIAISISTAVKPYLDTLGIARVDFDANRLDLTLDLLSEEGTESTIPTHIQLTALPIDDSYTARATLLNRERAGSQIFVELPLFKIMKKPKSEEIIRYDPSQVNGTLVHELQHVVDFSDDQMLSDIKAHNEESATSLRQYIRKGRLFQTILASTGLAGGGILEHFQGKSLSAGALTVCGLASAVLLNRYDKRSVEVLKFSHYLSDPTEQRAYAISSALSKRKINPNIVTLRRN
jgi:hypothetical protein